MLSERRPLRPDPLVTYDALGRKQPKRVGLIEVLRMVPGVLKVFDKEVPPDRFSYMVADRGASVLVASHCKVEEPLRVPFNTAVFCEGEGCRRWFFYDGRNVRVAREPDPPTVVVD